MNDTLAVRAQGRPKPERRARGAHIRTWVREMLPPAYERSEQAGSPPEREGLGEGVTS